MAQIKKEENVRRLSDLIEPFTFTTPRGVIFCPYITCVLQPDPITGSPHLQTKDKYDFLKKLLSGKAKGKIVKWQN